MSGADDYRAQLAAKIAGLTNDRDFNKMLYDKSTGPETLDRPSDKFIEANIGEPDLRTDDDIGMEAWNSVQQEQGDVYAKYQENQRLEERAADAEKDKKDMDQQRERDQADQKIRLEEQAKEKQRIATEQERQETVSQENEHAARATEAEKKRQEALSVMKDQEQSNPQDSELDSYREQFRQAAERSQGIDRDIE